MKSVRYFTLNFSGFTTAVSEKQGYLRLIAGEHVFYTDKRYFNDPSLFDRLKINQPLHLGARRLDNGSYWIHWLSDGETHLEPSQHVKRWARPLLFISLLTLIVPLIPLLVSASEWGRFGCGIIAILAFIALLTGLYERLFHPALKRHPAMRDLLAKMALARRRDVSFCQPLPATTQALRQSAMLLRKPCRNAMPLRQTSSSTPTLRSGMQAIQPANITASGYNAVPCRWPSGGRQAALISRCIRCFTVVSRRFLPPAIASSPYTSATAGRSMRYTMPATTRLI